jgi:hypothetical protein
MMKLDLSRQQQLNECLETVFKVLNESRLSLDELFYIIGEIVVSTGVLMGSKSPTKHDIDMAISGVPAGNLAEWIRNTGLLILNNIGVILNGRERIENLGAGTSRNSQKD